MLRADSGVSDAPSSLSASRSSSSGLGSPLLARSGDRGDRGDRPARPSFSDSGSDQVAEPASRHFRADPSGQWAALFPAPPAAAARAAAAAAAAAAADAPPAHDGHDAAAAAAAASASEDSRLCVADDHPWPDDDDEEAEVVTSSFLRHTGMREYTKLEVMHSDAIRNLICFYHAWLLLAVVITVITVALPLVRYRLAEDIPLPLAVPGLLTMDQFREGVSIIAEYERETLRQQLRGAGADSGSLRASSSGSSTAAVRAAEPHHSLAPYMRVLPSTTAATTSTAAPALSSARPPEVLGDPFAVFLADRGLFHCYPTVYCDLCTGKLALVSEVEAVRAEYRALHDVSLSLDPVGIASGAAGKVFLSPPFRPSSCDDDGDDAARLLVRASDDLTPEEQAQRDRACENRLREGLSCTNPPTVTLGEDAMVGGTAAADVVATEPSGSPSQPVVDEDAAWEEYEESLYEWYLSVGRGPDGVNPGSYVRAVGQLQPPVKYSLLVFAFSIFASVVALVMAAIYLVRIVRLGRNQITHEQIWIVVLLTLASLYWNAPEAVTRIDIALELDDLNKPDGYKSFLPAWWETFRLIIAAVREPAFSGIVFFYTWANLHTYRILNPTAHLGFVSFYVPKFGIVFPYILYKALGHPTLNLYLSEVPIFSSLAWMRHYNRFRVWHALRAELLYSIGATLIELALMAILVAEAFKTNNALRESKYMKYRTKQIGYRFFAYVTGTFLITFAALHLVSLMAVPSSQYFAGLGLIRIIWLKDTEMFQVGPSILLAGYAITMAYVNLPKDAIGIFKGWFVSSKLGQSFSLWSRSVPGSAPVSHNMFDDDDEAGSRLLDLAPDTGSTSPTVSKAGFQSQQVALRPARQDSLGIVSMSSSLGGRPYASTASVEPRTGDSSGDDRTMIEASDSESEAYDSGPSSSTADRRKFPKFDIDEEDQELRKDIAEPVRYRMREDPKTLELRANSFIMETHVLMFNFAWYVYYYGTSKDAKVQPRDQSRFKVFAHVFEPSTETSVLVVDCGDRIVVTFKGTTSKMNLRTSMNAFHERLQSVTPSEGGDEETERKQAARMNDLFRKTYRDAQVHKGFAVAYRSVASRVVSAVQRLLSKRKRPIFLTGHSLGGALATICSLDLWLRLGLSRRDILVSTFGSPRVGNNQFREVYQSVVPLHWRIVVVPDMITKLPKVGYRHVGKKVSLTPYGRMLIDPNLLDQLHWSKNTAAFAYHRKASYMLAMRAWCSKHHRKYVPDFWSFPTTAEDMKRFPKPFESTSETGDVQRNPEPARIIQMDAKVEALGADDDDEPENTDILELWARLARRALLDERLQKGATR